MDASKPSRSRSTRVREPLLFERFERARKGACQSPLETVTSGGFSSAMLVQRLPERLRQQRVELAVTLVEEDQRASRAAAGRARSRRARRSSRTSGTPRRRTRRRRCRPPAGSPRRCHQRLRLRHDPLEHAPHPVERLDRDARERSADELPGQLAGARGEVEDDRSAGRPDGVERGSGISRPPARTPRPPGRSCRRASTTSRRRRGGTRGSRAASRGRSRGAGPPASPRRSA